MGTVSRGAIKAPNQANPGNRVASSGPMGRGPAFADVPNDKNKTARVNSSGPMSRGRSDVTPPNDSKFRFKVEDAQMGQPGSVVSPGKGDIPVSPSPFVGGLPASMLRGASKK